jgi:hypothetical protein
VFQVPAEIVPIVEQVELLNAAELASKDILEYCARNVAVFEILLTCTQVGKCSVERLFRIRGKAFRCLIPVPRSITAPPTLPVLNLDMPQRSLASILPEEPPRLLPTDPERYSQSSCLPPYRESSPAGSTPKPSMERTRPLDSKPSSPPKPSMERTPPLDLKPSTPSCRLPPALPVLSFDLLQGWNSPADGHVLAASWQNVSSDPQQDCQPSRLPPSLPVLSFDLLRGWNSLADRPIFATSW